MMLLQSVMRLRMVNVTEAGEHFHRDNLTDPQKRIWYLFRPRPVQTEDVANHEETNRDTVLLTNDTALVSTQ